MKSENAEDAKEVHAEGAEGYFATAGRYDMQPSPASQRLRP